MAVPSDVAERILVEVMQGKPPAQEDTPEEAEFRAQVTEECAEIEAQGLTVSVPSEIPGNS